MKDELTKNRRQTTKPRCHKQCLKLADLFAQCCRLKNTSLVLSRRASTCFKDPRRQFDESDEVWYDNMVVGQLTLGDEMKKLSIEAKLSCVSTNHSIRATTITILDECGYEARHIMALSGHRSESSIRSYASQTSLSTKRKTSETLPESLNNKKTVSTITATSSVGHSEIAVAESAPEPLFTASRKSIFEMS